MLTNENISLTSLINLSDTGLNIANFSQIKAALIAQYKFVYGQDIDVDDTTADGVFVNNISLLINNILQVCSDIYASLNVNTATGEQLDILCALSNIRRKPATKSNATLLVTYTGQDSVTYTPEEIVFIDKSGNEWLPITNVSFSAQNETQSVFVECRKAGSISAPAQYIYQTIDATLPLTVVQNNPANIGLEKEDDFSLRSRQVGSGSAKGTTTISSLEASLRSISGIQDVKLINNPTASATTLADSASLPGHSVYVALRLQEGVTVPDSTIGNILYSKLTPGINSSQASTTSGIRKSYEVDTSVNGVSSSILDTQTVQWKQCVPYSSAAVFTMTKYDWFSTDNIESIAKRMMSYINNLGIGVTPTQTDLTIQLMSADPRFKGRPTYIVSSVQSFSTNPLTFYNYKYYTYSISNSTVTLTLMTVEPSEEE